MALDDCLLVEDSIHKVPMVVNFVADNKAQSSVMQDAHCYLYCCYQFLLNRKKIDKDQEDLDDHFDHGLDDHVENIYLHDVLDSEVWNL